MTSDMAQPMDLRDIHEKIRLIKDTALELNRIGDRFPALEKNTARILASVKMLEMNVTDMVDL